MTPRSLADNLIAASGAADILAAIARAVWHADHDGADCPSDLIPEPKPLAAWIRDGWPADVGQQVADRTVTCTRIVDCRVEQLVQQGDGASVKAALEAARLIQAVLLRMVEPPDADPATEDSPPDEIGPFRQFNLSEIHSLWQLAIEAAQADDRPPPQHPIAPVVRTWQEHAPLDRRQTGIMPAAAGVQIEPGALVRPDPSHLPDFGELRHADPGGNLWLPGLDIDAGGAAAFILAILDAGSTAQPGAGAPLRDRFFAEMLMAASTKARATRTRWFLDDLRIADPVEWADWNPAHYRPEAEKRGLALSRALVAVNSIQLPLNDRGGWLIPVFVEAIKSRALDDPIIASVRLPEGSNRGARVDRPTLRRAGKASAVAWRLYLALCFEWNRIAVKGRIPHLTRPQMKRNIAGYLVDARDKILTDSRGQPMRSGKHARAVETGGREPSPAGERLHRVYDGPADLVRLVWPLGAPGERAHPERSQKQAIRAARWLAGEPGAERLNRVTLDRPAIRIERLGEESPANPHCFPWRIVPTDLK